MHRLCFCLLTATCALSCTTPVAGNLPDGTPFTPSSKSPAASSPGSSSPGSGSPGGSSKSQPQRVRNLSYFDLAQCFPRQVPPPEQVTEMGLLGIVLATRPQVMECLVDPAARGKEDVTRVVVTTTVRTDGVDSTLKGENLTAEGERCVREVIVKATEALRVAPSPVLRVGKLPKKAAYRDVPPPPTPVTAEAQFQHTRDQAPTVTFGVNGVSDAVGTLRLAQKSWCDCYEGWRSEPPRSLNLKLKLAPVEPDAASRNPAAPREAALPLEVELTPTGNARADAVAACLKRKVSALPLPSSQKIMTLPSLPFHHVHSGLLKPLEDAVPDVQLVHLQAMRGQRAADTATALGERTAAARVFDRLLRQYRATPAAVMVEDLKDMCAAVLKADDAWAEAVTRQLTLDQHAVGLIGELKVKAASWDQAEASARAMVEQTQQDLETARQTRADDEAGCPQRVLAPMKGKGK